MKKKILLVAVILIGAIGSTRATIITSAANGAWTNGATWGGSVVPGSGDAAIVNHDVSLSSSASVGGSVNVGSTGGPGLLTLNNGAVLNSVSNTILAAGSRKGTVVINNGAVWTNAARINVGAGSSTSYGVGEGKMIVNGGRYVGSTTASSLLFGNAAYSNVIASVVLTNGASWVQGANVSFSAANAGTSVETLDIYKNSSFQATYITATAVAALTYGVNVKGGDLILTQAAENSALQSAAKIYFDAGTIKFTGVDTLTDYNTFTNSWNTWVDNGMITSTAGYTASQLKGALSFDGTDAIATIQPRLRTIKLFIIR
jgi:hypothetical protein